MKSKLGISALLASSLTLVIAGQVFADEASNDANCIKNRAAFDIGSSETKMKVFKVNVCDQTAEQIYPEKGNEKQKCEANSKRKISRMMSHLFS
jgi:hypothetical protein